MAKVTGDLVIQRPLDVVVDVVADERNGPRYSPALLRVRASTPATSSIASAERRARRSDHGDPDELFALPHEPVTASH